MVSNPLWKLRTLPYGVKGWGGWGSICKFHKQSKSACHLSVLFIVACWLKADIYKCTPYKVHGMYDLLMAQDKHFCDIKLKISWIFIIQRRVILTFCSSTDKFFSSSLSYLFICVFSKPSDDEEFLFSSFLTISSASFADWVSKSWSPDARPFINDSVMWKWNAYLEGL